MSRHYAVRATPVIATVIVLAAAALAAETTFKEPSGWEKAKFRAKIDAVRLLYPDLKKFEVPTAPPLPDSGLPPFPLERWTLNQQKVGDMICPTIMFQFFQQQLTHIEFYCGDAEKTQAYLIKEYGEPSLKDETSWQWLGKRTLIVFSPTSGVFNLADKLGNDALQGNLYIYYLATPEQRRESQPPTLDLNNDPNAPPPQPRAEGAPH